MLGTISDAEEIARNKKHCHCPYGSFILVVEGNKHVSK